MNNPKFIVDSMLGNIARKLRIIGFDTEFLLHIKDEFLIKKSIDENKLLVTKDKQLYNRSSRCGIPSLLLPSNNELENLVFIFRKCGIHHINLVPNTNTRCTMCNGTLLLVDKSSLFNFIPEKVYNTATIFYKCSNCLKIYWNGTHIKNINTLIDNINKSLDRY